MSDALALAHARLEIERLRILVEADRIDLARSVLQRVRVAGKSLLLPVDHVAAVGGDDANVRTTPGVALADDEADRTSRRNFRHQVPAPAR